MKSFLQVSAFLSLMLSASLAQASDLRAGEYFDTDVFTVLKVTQSATGYHAVIVSKSGYIMAEDKLDQTGLGSQGAKILGINPGANDSVLVVIEFEGQILTHTFQPVKA